MVTLILDPRVLLSYLVCSFESRKMATVVAKKSSLFSPLPSLCSPPSFLSTYIETRSIDRSIEPRGKKRARDRVERTIEPMFVSESKRINFLRHGTRCRTLCITRGKENVETARGTRHDCITVCGACTARCITSVCAYVLRLAPIDIATDDYSGGTVGKNASDAFHRPRRRVSARRVSSTL